MKRVYGQGEDAGDGCCVQKRVCVTDQNVIEKGECDLKET